MMGRLPAPPARILVVDDEAPVRAFVARVLGNAGYSVQSAGSGAEAIEIAAADSAFDLIVADVRMPDMSGPEAVTRLRRAGSQAKVLYLTGFADQLFQERHEALWADEAFLEKPTTIAGITEAVALLLSGHLPRSHAAV